MSGSHGGFNSHPTMVRDPNYHTICFKCDKIISFDGYTYHSMFKTKPWYPRREYLRTGGNTLSVFCKGCRNHRNRGTERHEQLKDDPNYRETRRIRSQLFRDRERAANARSEAFPPPLPMPTQETMYYQSRDQTASTASQESAHSWTPVNARTCSHSQNGSHESSGERHGGRPTSQVSSSESQSSYTQSNFAHGARSEPGSSRSTDTLYDAIGAAGGRSSRQRSTLSRVEEGLEDDGGFSGDEKRWRRR